MKWAWSECCRVCTSLTLTIIKLHSLKIFKYSTKLNLL